MIRKPVILVVGAGVGGLCAALALRRAGFAAFVIDNQPAAYLRAQRVGVPLWAQALRVLDRLGLGARIRQLALPTLRCEILSARARVGSATGAPAADGRWAPLATMRVEQFSQGCGAEAFVVDRAELEQVLLEALPPHTVVANCKFASMTPPQASGGLTRRVRLEFNDGRATEDVQAALVIGADGKRSVVRSYVKRNAAWRYAGYTHWQGIVDVDPRHHTEDALFPRFVAREVWGAGARFGFMPMSPGRVYWYASVNARRRGEVFLRPFKRVLQERFRDWPHGCTVLLDACSEAAIVRSDAYELAAGADPTLPVVSERIALIGNAAYPATGNLHQQTCMAVEDAFSLAQSIGRYGLKDRTALDVYATARARRTLELASSHARLLARIAQWERPLLVRARDALMTRAARQPALQRLLTRLGAYHAGDLPLSRPARAFALS
mmetsp:Transcript_6996/g.18757  ORF Transcript_6996/g.18757 Transcript_6996/m.18757 type:complete len:439 (-) Transcript_6996:373-1689(-)